MTRLWAVLAVRAEALGDAGKPKRRPRRFLGSAEGEQEKTPPHAAPPQNQAPENGDLPESYGHNRVVLMVVSPYLVHAYWDLDGKASASAPGTSACLRFHDTTAEQPPSSFDVPVNLPAKNWYVHLWGPARQYHAELGLNQDGAFAPLARSNSVETPRAWPVAEVQERFLRVGESVPPIEVALAPLRSSTPWPASSAPAAASAATPATLPLSHAIPVQAVTAIETNFAAPLPDIPMDALSIPAEPVPPVPSIPRLVDAAEVLRQRLTELYAFRWWRQRPAGAPAPTAADLALPLRPDAPGDLTGLADSQFTPGFSSSLLGLAASKTSAG
ncbi:MAG: DUF4912 domain-containing protein [Acidobacteriia bacterium]|nr:DUF4912 domain-containing protein [Terriglobia bacterium]